MYPMLAPSAINVVCHAVACFSAVSRLLPLSKGVVSAIAFQDSENDVAGRARE